MAPVGAARAARVLDAIPDSGGTNQWNYSEGSGSAVSDYIGSLDASFSSLTWNGTAGVGGYYGDLDGTNDYGDLGTASRSELSHFVNSGTGTLFSWVYFTGDSEGMIIGNFVDNTVRSFFFRAWDTANDGLAFGMSTGSGSYDILIEQTGQLPTNEWRAVAATCDGSNASMYVAEPSDDYTVTEVGTDTVSGTASGDLQSYNVHLGAGEGGGTRLWEGGLDLQFTDNTAWSESELQSFVDDSKGFYQ